MLPTGDSDRYDATLRFVNEPWPPKFAWSLVATKLSESIDAYNWIADIYCLVPGEPHDSLMPGARLNFLKEESGSLTANRRRNTLWTVALAEREQQNSHTNAVWLTLSAYRQTMSRSRESREVIQPA